MDKQRVAVIDDWLNVAAGCADWSALEARAEVVFSPRNFPKGDEDAAAEALADFDIILPMRERSWFHAPLLKRLPRLKMLSLTGAKAPHVDFDYCTEHGIVVSQSAAAQSSHASELALGLMIAAARNIPAADAGMRAGRFQDGAGLGIVLRGRTLGILGLGKLGTQLASYARALGMRVIAWSQNMTKERAEAAGAEFVGKDQLFAQSDVVSLQLVLSERTRGIVGAADIARMKPGAILVNTSRGPLVDEAALLQALVEGRIVAALDVYDEEPLPPDHPLRRMPNTVLSPHLGFSTKESFEVFYRGAIDNILAFLDGAPSRVANPAVLERR